MECFDKKSLGRELQRNEHNEETSIMKGNNCMMS